MTDSNYKNLVDLLAAGTWTSTPGVIQVTQGTENLLDLAKRNMSNNACVIVMPPAITHEFNDGFRTEVWEHEVHVYRFAFTRPDTGLDELETLISDMNSILKADVVAGFNDNYIANWVNLTDRNKDYARAVAFVRMEAWIT